jgi:hypothetical protein
VRSTQLITFGARCSAIRTEVGSHFTSWVSCPKMPKSPRPGRSPSKKSRSAKPGSHQIEQPLIGGFDDRLGDVGGADEFAAPDLTLGDEVVVHPGAVGIELQIARQGEQRAGLVDAVLIRPAIVVHRLGDPLVAEVLDDGVDQRECRIGGDDAAVGVLAFESHDLWRRVDGDLTVAAVGVGVHDHGDQPHRRLGKVVPLRVAQHPAKRDVAVAQHSPHLEGVGRAVLARKHDRVVAHTATVTIDSLDDKSSTMAAWKSRCSAQAHRFPTPTGPPRPLL